MRPKWRVYVLCVRLDKEMRRVMVDRNILEILHPLIFSLLHRPFNPKTPISYDGERAPGSGVCVRIPYLFTIFFLLAILSVGFIVVEDKFSEGRFTPGCGGCVCVCVCGSLWRLYMRQQHQDHGSCQWQMPESFFFLRTSLPLSPEISSKRFGYIWWCTREWYRAEKIGGWWYVSPFGGSLYSLPHTVARP